MFTRAARELRRRCLRELYESCLGCVCESCTRAAWEVLAKAARELLGRCLRELYESSWEVSAKAVQELLVMCLRELYESASGRLRTLQDASGRLRTPQDASRRLTTPQEASGRLTTPHDAPRRNYRHLSGPSESPGHQRRLSLTGTTPFQRVRTNISTNIFCPFNLPIFLTTKRPQSSRRNCVPQSSVSLWRKRPSWWRLRRRQERRDAGFAAGGA